MQKKPEATSKMDNVSSMFTTVAVFAAGYAVAALIRRFTGQSVSSSTIPTQSQSMQLRLATLLAANPTRSHKMQMIVRTDVGMKHGKMAAQCAHAAVMCYKRAKKTNPDDLAVWEATGCTKICLKFGDGEDALRELKKQAEDRNITAALVQDAGHTQVEAGTVTVLGLGPAPEEKLKEITGHLKLL